jgi:hypothetical protein
MHGHADLSALLAMRLVIAVIDQQHGVVVGQRAGRSQAEGGVAVRVGGEAVALSRAVEEG